MAPYNVAAKYAEGAAEFPANFGGLLCKGHCFHGGAVVDHFLKLRGDSQCVVNFLAAGIENSFLMNGLRRVRDIALSFGLCSYAED